MQTKIKKKRKESYKEIGQWKEEKKPIKVSEVLDPLLKLKNKR